MDHGRILALDAPASLKDSVGADTEVRVSADGDLERLAAKLTDLAGVTGTQVIDGAVSVSLRGNHLGPAGILSAAEAAGYRVTDVGITEPTLETVFINLTGKDLRE